MPGREGSNSYLLLDSWSQPLAKGRLESRSGTGELQIQILDNQVDQVVEHEVIQLVRIDQDDRPLKCRIIQSRNDCVVLEPLELLDPSVRHNLRIPVRFSSFLYPCGGKRSGRREIQSVDLSCGGIAFYGDAGLSVGETMEVVIPITKEPLIVRCEILRVKELKNDRALYAAKFVDLCHDEEKTIRHAVFSTQISDGKRQKKV